MSTSRFSSPEGSPAGRRIPRPPNSFILFRRDTLSQGNVAKTFVDPSTGFTRPRGQPDLSKEIGVLWREAPDDVKRRYSELADQYLYEHRGKYPGYKYKPQKSKKSEKDSRRDVRTTSSKLETGTSYYMPTDSRIRTSSSTAAYVQPPPPLQWHPNVPPLTPDQVYPGHTPYAFGFHSLHLPGENYTPQLDPSPAVMMQAAYQQHQGITESYTTYNPHFPEMQASVRRPEYRSTQNIGIDPRLLQ
ncbi:hypothetical protein E1B28_013112 [Marasmius oreades]|uniref:HMG box domain-containing protein n=1 Tax=Marasmius oreades TaxID=181124 RepID=A0A9P7RQB2_9AGAR|nr:uncharacterized protein E1B28_013112 [Marasmius oreades]KAG7087133.1 hypothetical protein E1B28_013112 [Marasmius oreades]